MLSVLLVCAVTVVPGDTTRASKPAVAPVPVRSVTYMTSETTVSSVTVVTRSTRPVAVKPLASAMARPKKFDADSLVLDKSDRRLTLYYRGQVVQQYEVALGKNPVGNKQQRGDGRTPEGLYYIEGRNPESKYHLSLRISYPSDADRANASRRGITAGGDIMIHGLPQAFASVGALHRQQDWTEGCIALTNAEIEEIWRGVPNGARILIRP